MGRGSGGCYTGRDAKTGELTARRNLFQKMKEPKYSMSKVPNCNQHLEGAVVLQPPSREAWFTAVPEMLLVCNEAQRRFLRKNPSKAKGESENMQSKPLGLEYIADRVDTDDPIKGYVEACITDDEKRARAWDYDGSIARALQGTPHSGNPKQEGIVWKRLAEISLLGALGCGRQLLQAVIEELEMAGEYEYVVLQATDNAVGFYERMGFVRVGAIAKPDQEFLTRQAEAQEKRRKEKAEQIEGKRKEKQRKRDDRESADQNRMQEQNEGWRSLCLALLDVLLSAPHAHRLLHAPPDSRMQPGQLCVDLASVREALEAEGTEVWGGGGGGELDPTAWAKEVSVVQYGDAEEFARDVCLVLDNAQQWNGGRGAASARAMLGVFKTAWQAYGEQEGGKGGGGESKFCLYVDLEWQAVRGFRLFEVFGELKEAGTKSELVKAREWHPSRELEPRGGYAADKFSFVPKDPKPRRMKWSARRSVDGQLQTATLPVSVVHLSRKREDKEEFPYLEIEEQGRRVTAAYTKLLALRGISDPPPGVRGEKSKGGKKKASGGPDEEMSEYERKRLERMRENQKLLEGAGIVATFADAGGEGEAGQGENGRKRKRRKKKVADANRERKVTRSRLSAGQGTAGGEGGEGAVDWTADMSPMKDSPLKGRAEGGTPKGKKRNGKARDDEEDEDEDEDEEEGEEDEEDDDNENEGDGEEGEDEDAHVEAVPASRLHPCGAGDTARKVAARYRIDLNRLLQLNKEEVPGLWGDAKLKARTLLKLPSVGETAEFTPLDELPHAPKGWAAYCHWTYPDQDMDELYPSYMMARRLEHRNQSDDADDSAYNRVQARFCDVPPTIRTAQELQALIRPAIPSPEPEATPAARRRGREAEEGRGEGAGPVDGVYRCKEDDRVKDVAARFGVSADWVVAMNRDLYPGLNKTVPLKAGTTLRLPDPAADGAAALPPWHGQCLQIITKLLAARHAWPFLQPLDWEAMGLMDYPFICPHPMDLGTVRSKLVTARYATAAEFAADVKLTFDNAATFNPPEDTVHKLALKMQCLFDTEWQAMTGASGGEQQPQVAGGKKGGKHVPMYNKVVRLVDDPDPGKFYFVLHFVPDMLWCHLVPLQRDGVFPKTLRNGAHPSAGRPRWKLTPEGEGEELDCSAERCVVVKSVTVNKTADADKEAWDIVEDRDKAGGDGAAAAAAAKPGHGQAQGAGQGGRASRPSGQSEDGEEMPPAGGKRRGRPPSSGKGAGEVGKRGGGGGKQRSEEEEAAEEAQWVEECVRIWKKLVKHEKAWPFMEPVDAEALNLPDYHTIITEPMDLSTVRRRLDGREYASSERFAREVALTLDNAMRYNPEGNFVYKYAAAVKAHFEHLCAQSPLLGGKGGGERGPPPVQAADKEYVAVENETPRTIAKKTDTDVQVLLALNQARYPGLVASSRFKRGSHVMMPLPTKRRRSPSAEPLTKYRRQASPVFENPPPQPSKPPPVSPLVSSRKSGGGALAAGFATNLGKSGGRAGGEVRAGASARTVAMKVVDSLLKRVQDSESGRTLKLTSVVPLPQLAALLKALGGNKSTTRLDLEGCGIGDEGAKRLAGLLRKRTCLEELDLQFNQISDVGAEALAKGLAASTLRQIHIGNNNLTERGARVLLAAVEENQEEHGDGIDLIGVQHLLDGAGDRSRGRSPARERSVSPARR